jgi:glycerol uptake facilitator protein
MASGPPLISRCFAECLGTFILVFFGCGSVHAAVLTGAQSGLWQVAVVWGVAIMVATYVVGGISGSHINPAITLAFWVWGGFPGRLVPFYLASQFAGAFLAGSCLFFFYQAYLEQREADLKLTRGQPGSEMTAMCFGEYFPNPGRWEASWREILRTSAKSSTSSNSPELFKILDNHQHFVSREIAFAAEFLGTLILALVVFAVTEPKNLAAPQGQTAPIFIGLTVSILISVIDPLTQACFNPARDFGPRTVAWLGGWGDIAWPGSAGLDGTLLVYGLAPILGALCGGAVFRFFLRPAYTDALLGKTS